MGIFIDTEIWSFAQKKPVESKFTNGYEDALEMHSKSKEFLLQNIDREILMSYHQIAEIYHVLAYRGLRLPISFVQEYVRNLLQAKNIIKYEVTCEHVEDAIDASKRSGIHIWDFLCVLPVSQGLDIIYTCDQHFLHDEFKGLNVEIINPVGEWMRI
jgi:predicted nucleic acid-binding protein